MKLDEFVKARGDMRCFARKPEEIPALVFRGAARTLELPDMTRKNFVKWMDAFELQNKAFVCGDRHLSTDDGSAQGLIVFYFKDGKTYTFSPEEFAKRIERLMRTGK